jgi:serine/threonine protein kinase
MLYNLQLRKPNLKQWIVMLILGYSEQDQERMKNPTAPLSPPFRSAWLCGAESDSSLINFQCEPDNSDQMHMSAGPSFMPMILKEDISTLKLKRRLGRGGSDNADVFLSTWHHYSNVQDVAQKMFLVRSNGYGSFRNEVSIMAKLNHPNIVRLLCYAEDHRTQSIVMELMDGDLNDLLERRLTEDATREVPFSMDEAVDMMLQIAAAMNYLHQNKIVHQDLKSDNILFKDVMEGTWTIKVADFGLAQDLGSHDNSQHSPERVVCGKDVSSVATYRGNIGTIRWMAPELISIHGNEDGDDTSHNPYKSDVYSFAMVCSAILTGHVPFSDIQDPSEIQTKVMEGERPVLPNECHPKLKALIGRCWHPVIPVRPKFAKIIEELEGILLEQHNDHSLCT